MSYSADPQQRSRFSSAPKPPLPDPPPFSGFGSPGCYPGRYLATHHPDSPPPLHTPPGSAPGAAGAAWSHVSLSYITDLPPSTSLDGRRCTAVVALLDRLTRQARFLPASEPLSAREVAALFTTHLPGRFGPPKLLLWDRDSEPGGPGEAEQAFWRQLCTLLHAPVSPLPQQPPDAPGGGTPGTALFTTRRVIEQLIRGHAHEVYDHWASFLHLAEAAFNGTQPNTLSAGHPLAVARSTSGLAALGGPMRHPASAPATPRGSRDASSGSASPSAVHFAQLREVLVRAQQELQDARARYGSHVSHRSSTGGASSCGGGGGGDAGVAGVAGGSRAIGRSISCGGSVNGFGTTRMNSNAGSSSSSINSGGSASTVSNSSSSSSSGSSGSLSYGGRLATDGAGGVSGSPPTTAPAAFLPARPTDPRFAVGDRVRLSTTHLVLPDQPGVRLRPGFLGPFTVVGVVSPAAYRLELPASLGRLHPVFHVSRLMAWTEPAGETRIPPLSPRLVPATPPQTAAAAAPAAPAGSTSDGSSPSAVQLSALRTASFISDAGAEVEAEAGPGSADLGGVVTGVRVGYVGRLQPTVMFLIRWATPRGGGEGREDSWEPYAAVQKLPAVRAFLRSHEWREWKKTDAAQQFSARWPDRMPRLVRFEV